MGLAASKLSSLSRASARASVRSRAALIEHGSLNADGVGYYINTDRPTAGRKKLSG